MTTTATRPLTVPEATRGATRPGSLARASARRPGSPRTRGRRAARTAAVSVAATVALSVPALALLGRPDTATVDLVTTFLLVGALELVAARAVWRVTRERSRPAAHAALLARLGYGLLVILAALVLLARGAGGTGEFRDHWVAAVGVLGLQLIAAAAALWQGRVAGRLAPLVAGTAGGVAMLAALVPGWDVPVAGALLPAVVGEVALVGACVRAGLARR